MNEERENFINRLTDNGVTAGVANEIYQDSQRRPYYLAALDGRQLDGGGDYATRLVADHYCVVERDDEKEFTIYRGPHRMDVLEAS